MTMTDLDQLIDDLSDDGRRVKAHSTARGRTWFAGVALATLALVGLIRGFRPDVVAMSPWPILSVAAGLMLILAVAAGLSAIRMARPQVGAAASPAPWLFTALMLLPLVALLQLIAEPSLMPGLSPATGLRCLGFGLAAGVGTAAFLALWLRRGAPVAHGRAAMLTGLTAGAVGALAVTMECPIDSLQHLGVWHVAVVPISAVAARVVLPSILRW